MARSQQNPRGRLLVVLVPYLWLGFFFLAPFLIVLKISLSHDVIAQPPYAPLLEKMDQIGRASCRERV